MKCFVKIFVIAVVASVAATLPAASTTDDLAMIFQVVQQFQNCAQSKNLDGIHNEDAIIAVAVNELLANPPHLGTNQRASFKTDLTTLGQRSGDLHQAADTGQQAAAENALNQVMAAFEKVKNYFPLLTHRVES